MNSVSSVTKRCPCISLFMATIIFGNTTNPSRSGQTFGSIYRQSLPSVAKIAHTKFTFDQWHTRSKRVQRVTTTFWIRVHAVGNMGRHLNICTENSDQPQAFQKLGKRLSPSASDIYPVKLLFKMGIMACLKGMRSTHPMSWSIQQKWAPTYGLVSEIKQRLVSTALLQTVIWVWCAGDLFLNKVCMEMPWRARR